MYWKNFMISYTGKDSICFIHELKYDYDSVSSEQFQEDLKRLSNIKRLVVELKPGEFDNYANHLSWDKKFYGIPAHICKQTIDDWNKAQELTPEQKASIKARYNRPMNFDDLELFKGKISKDELREILLLHDKIRVEIYHKPPYGIEYYKDILDNFPYKE